MPQPSQTADDSRRQAPQPAQAGGVAMALESLTFGYRPGEAVICEVSASLRAGRLTVLIGPNAAGKSTLLRLMLGLLRPGRGRVTLGGRDVAAMGEAERARRVSYVPQRGAVSFAFTVRQVAAMGRFAIGGDADAAVDQALRRCDLTEVAHRAYNELSGGQQQRVAMARALAQASPPEVAAPPELAASVEGAGITSGGVMLLDEPVSAMDLWHAHHTLGLLREEVGRGRAVLVVLHDLNLAARWADEVWLMDGGRLMQAGPWDAVLRPDVLEPIYRVGLTPLTPPGGGNEGRPVFCVDPGVTI